MTEATRAELMEKMADALPVLRAKRRLTQEQLADLLDVSRHTVLLIENKKRSMTWCTFLALILLFSVHSDTAVLMKALGIYTDSLEHDLKQ